MLKKNDILYGRERDIQIHPERREGREKEEVRQIEIYIIRERKKSERERDKQGRKPRVNEREKERSIDRQTDIQRKSG